MRKKMTVLPVVMLLMLFFVAGNAMAAGGKATPTEMCYRYLEGLNKGDLDLVLSLFAPGAKVHSPLYGLMDAKEFYADLFADTNRSVTKPLNVLVPADDSPAVALHFSYDWEMADGQFIPFEVVDVIEMTPDRQKFTKLTIIYDTVHARPAFEKLQKANKK